MRVRFPSPALYQIELDEKIFLPDRLCADRRRIAQGGSARISTGSVASVPLTLRMTLPGMLWPALKRLTEATSG
jgi:hypothetical protein